MESTEYLKSFKVAIVGAGFVCSSAVNAIMMDCVASEIAIIDINKEKAEGHNIVAKTEEK